MTRKAPVPAWRSLLKGTGGHRGAGPEAKVRMDSKRIPKIRKRPVNLAKVWEDPHAP